MKHTKEWRLKVIAQHSRVEDKPSKVDRDGEPSSYNEEWTRITSSKRDKDK